MKAHFIAVVSCAAALFSARAQLATAGADLLAQAGPHHVVLRPSADAQRLGGGRDRSPVVELATGMNYWDGQAWQPSEPVFSLEQDAFVANKIQHRLRLNADINTQGAVGMSTPESQLLYSTPVGIGLYDRASGRFALIGTITNSIGLLAGSGNQVVYQNAFHGLCAEIWYSIEQDAFHQDVVFTGRLNPAEYGFDPKTTQLQILTEFYDPPLPEIERQPAYIEQDPAVRRRMASPDLMDERLAWGSLVVGGGQAYTTATPQQTNGTTAGVVKEFRQVEGRRFLIESVAYLDLKVGLESLPECLPAGGGEQGAVRKKNLHYGYAALPKPAAIKSAAKPARKPAAQMAALRPRGVVVDYRAALTAGTTLLQGDVTYLVTNSFSCSSLTVEGGSVIKYKLGAAIWVSGSVAFKTSQWRPAIFTAIDDDTVGESMNGFDAAYTGTINSGGYANPALALSSGSLVSGCRFLFAQKALANSTYPTSFTLTAKHCQFIKCLQGITLTTSSSGCGSGSYPTCAALVVNNVLAGMVQYPFVTPTSIGLTLDAAHCTFDRCLNIWSGPWATLTSYNSVYANITNSNSGNLLGANNGFYSTAQQFGTAPSTVASSPFQTVGAGSYYLTDTSGFRNYGTTSGPPASLLADLKRRTTSPPTVMAATLWNTSQSLWPQAQRDTDLPDIGYHYDPLDYALGWVLATNCTVSLSNGTVVATFGTNTGTYGLAIGQGAALQSVGTPNNPNWFAQYNLVQEQPITNWFQTTDGQVSSEFQGLSPGSTIYCRFTQFSMPAQAAPQFNAPTNSGPFVFQDCEFHGGKLLTARPTLNLTNCLLERVYTDLQPKDSPTTTYMRNCLVLGGALTFAPTNSLVQDNLFDKTAITNWNGYNGTNAYITGYQRLQPTRPNDILLRASPAYQAGPLGSFYLLSNSSLINAGFGGTTADQVGLFHYTVSTNLVSGWQVKETNSVVDVTYHYVAVDTNGVPIDTDGDGIADYVEDADGDGTADAGETNWQSSENGTTGVTGLQVFTPWK